MGPFGIPYSLPLLFITKKLSMPWPKQSIFLKHFSKIFRLKYTKLTNNELLQLLNIARFISNRKTLSNTTKNSTQIQ